MKNIFPVTLIKLRILGLVSYATFNCEKFRYENRTQKVPTSFKKVGCQVIGCVRFELCRESNVSVDRQDLVDDFVGATIIIIFIIRHELGLDRPVSASSNSLLKGLPSRLHLIGLQFSTIFSIVLLLILVTCRSQFDLYNS